MSQQKHQHVLQLWPTQVNISSEGSYAYETKDAFYLKNETHNVLYVEVPEEIHPGTAIQGKFPQDLQ